MGTGQEVRCPVERGEGTERRLRVKSELLSGSLRAQSLPWLLGGKGLAVGGSPDIIRSHRLESGSVFHGRQAEMVPRAWGPRPIPLLASPLLSGVVRGHAAAKTNLRRMGWVR